MIDSHCHLADDQFDPDLPATVARARAAGVEKMICIADSLLEGEKCVRISKQYEYIFCTLGIHPHHASSWQLDTAQKLHAMIETAQKCVAVGEIGLDYHYNNSPPDVQRDVFTLQLEIAMEKNLPAVVHCREAVADVRDILTASGIERAVIHCCTEKWEDVQPIVEAGHFLSFTGIATYKNAEEIRTTIKECPIERIMIETDSPYLAPLSKRGQRNEPAFVTEILALVAELKGISIEEADRITTQNTVEFFGLPS